MSHTSHRFYSERCAHHMFLTARDSFSQSFSLKQIEKAMSAVFVIFRTQP